MIRMLTYKDSSRGRLTRYAPHMSPAPRKAGYKEVGVRKETGSGAKEDRDERKRILILAQARKSDATLITDRHNSWN